MHIFCIQIWFVGVTICLTSSVSLVHKTTFLVEGFVVFSLAHSFLDEEGFDVFSSTLSFLDGEGFDVFYLALSFLDGEGSDEFSSALSFLK